MASRQEAHGDCCSFFGCRELRSINDWCLADFKHDLAARDGSGCQASAALDDGVSVENSRTVLVGLQPAMNGC